MPTRGVRARAALAGAGWQFAELPIAGLVKEHRSCDLIVAAGTRAARRARDRNRGSAAGPSGPDLTAAVLLLSAGRQSPTFRRSARGPVRPYDRDVIRPAARMAALPRELAAWVTAQPARRQERLQDAGLAVALAVVNAATLLPYLEPAAPRVAGCAARRAAGAAAGLAPGRPGRRRARGGGGQGRLRLDRIRLRPVPAGSGHRVLHDHRPARPRLARRHQRTCRRRDHAVPARAGTQRALRRDLPGLHLPHRVGGGGTQPDQAGEPAGGERAARTRPRHSSTRRPPGPRRPSGAGSPGNCTMWSRITSA